MSTKTKTKSKSPAVVITPDNIGGVASNYLARRKLVEKDRATVDAEVAALKAQIASLEESFSAGHKDEEAALDGILTALAKHVAANEATLFPAGQRFVDIGGVRIGLRATPHSLVKPGKVTWDDMAGAVKLKAPGLAHQYVEPKWVLDRAGMLHDREEILASASLARELNEVGLRFAQDDVCYVEASDSQ